MVRLDSFNPASNPSGSRGQVTNTMSAIEPEALTENLAEGINVALENAGITRHNSLNNVRANLDT